MDEIIIQQKLISYKDNQDEQYNITNVTLYKEKQVSNIKNVTLACEDDWQLEARKMRDKYSIQRKPTWSR